MERAIQKSALFYTLIGSKVKWKGKIKVITRITAYKKEVNVWDVAIFFENKLKNSHKPDCFLSKFIKEYEVVSAINKE